MLRIASPLERPACRAAFGELGGRKRQSRAHPNYGEVVALISDQHLPLLEELALTFFLDKNNYSIISYPCPNGSLLIRSQIMPECSLVRVSGLGLHGDARFSNLRRVAGRAFEPVAGCTRGAEGRGLGRQRDPSDRTEIRSGPVVRPLRQVLIRGLGHVGERFQVLPVQVLSNDLHLTGTTPSGLNKRDRLRVLASAWVKVGLAKRCMIVVHLRWKTELARLRLLDSAPS